MTTEPTEGQIRVMVTSRSYQRIRLGLGWTKNGNRKTHDVTDDRKRKVAARVRFRVRLRGLR